MLREPCDIRWIAVIYVRERRDRPSLASNTRTLAARSSSGSAEPSSTAIRDTAGRNAILPTRSASPSSGPCKNSRESKNRGVWRAGPVTSRGIDRGTRHRAQHGREVGRRPGDPCGETGLKATDFAFAHQALAGLRPQCSRPACKLQPPCPARLTAHPWTGPHGGCSHRRKRRQMCLRGLCETSDELRLVSWGRPCSSNGDLNPCSLATTRRQSVWTNA